MSKKPPNEPIGKCPCPFRNCELDVPVYRYRSSTDDPAKQRHAGKLYLMCPTHRRSEDQEWILEHASINPDVVVPETSGDETRPTESEETKPAENDDDGKSGFGFFS